MTSAGEQQTRTPLTRERILEAAVQIVDEQGVDALTMRRLGSALGVEAMSIYNHIPNKAALLDAIVETVVSEIEIPPRDADWTDRIRNMGRSFRQMVQRHPQIVPLLARRPVAASMPALGPVEAALEAMADGGATPEQAADAYRSMVAFALGFSMTEVAELIGATPTEATEAPDLSGYPFLMEAVPHFIGADPERQFEFGVEVVIAGIKAQLER